MDDGLLRSTLDQPIKLDAFEGPLDLLLFLIRKNEIDIYDIPVESVTRQYLDILHRMERLNLEVAGEFFVMAATLMQIKSRMLLPRHEQLVQTGEEGEEGEDPRWELVQQLLEYRKFKDASVRLGDMLEAGADRMVRQYAATADELPERPLKPTDRLDVWNAFNQVLRRLAEKIVVGEIHVETVTVADRMEVVLHKLEERGRFTFSSLFVEGTTLVTIVATFLALLELTRLGKVKLEQTENFDDITCNPADFKLESDDVGADENLEESAPAESGA